MLASSTRHFLVFPMFTIKITMHSPTDSGDKPVGLLKSTLIMKQISNLRVLIGGRTTFHLCQQVWDYPSIHQAHKPFQVFGEVRSLIGHAVGSYLGTVISAHSRTQATVTVATTLAI